MATVGFGFCLLISVAVLIFMASKNYENINTYYWTMVILIPLIILGYWLKTRITTSEAAFTDFCYIYLDSTVLLTVMIFSMLYSLGISVKPWMKILGYSLAFLHMGMIWACFNTTLYYSSIRVIQDANGSITKMTSGPLKIVHLVYLIIIIGSIFAVLFLGFVKNGTYSRRTHYIYAALCFIGLAIYAFETLVDVDYSILPYLYVLGDLVIAFDYDHAHVHDISCLISEQQKYYSKKGYVAFDLKHRFLSCNSAAFDFMPELLMQVVDEKLPEESPLREIFYTLIDDYEQEGKASQKFKVGEMTCICEINHFSIRKDGKVQGYLFDMRDATEEQKVLDVMTSYNETLNDEVDEKTKNITNIQRKIVIGMANIIENRDNNTGGHVKRTSDIINIIVDEIKAQGKIQISDELARDIVRAAPMHDLGKVSIDSHILCKPGKLTDEEYAIMKTHSVKSGEMVKILLDGVEEKHFVDTAYNIARFHHERWDGKGYPEGLVGSMIPIEARIMAVADVYDALVSKRCYKEPMSYEKAAQIMVEGMGTQFDPNMREIFLGCHEKLEAYYSKAE